MKHGQQGAQILDRLSDRIVAERQVTARAPDEDLILLLEAASSAIQGRDRAAKNDEGGRAGALSLALIAEAARAAYIVSAWGHEDADGRALPALKWEELDRSWQERYRAMAAAACVVAMRACIDLVEGGVKWTPPPLRAQALPMNESFSILGRRLRSLLSEVARAGRISDLSVQPKQDDIAGVEELREALLPFALGHIRFPSSEQKERAFRLLGLDDEARLRVAITSLYPDHGAPGASGEPGSGG